jgi:hypothetical protein
MQVLTLAGRATPDWRRPSPRINGVRCTRWRVLDAPRLRQRACTELLRQAARPPACSPPPTPAPPTARSARPPAPRSSAAGARAQLPEPSPRPAGATTRPCRRGTTDRRARAGAAHPVRGDAGRRRGGTAQARRRPACSMCAATTPARRTVSRGGARLSNCPSGAEGGDLGWLCRADCAPEFARELFGQARGRRIAAPGAQPLRPACGRGAGARAGQVPAFEACAARSRRRCASRPSSRRCAVPAVAGRPGAVSKASNSTRPPRRWCSSVA